MSRPCFDGFGCGIELANYYASETLRLFDASSIRAELRQAEILLNWLNQIPSSVSICQETGETTAQVISWAIFGPAVQ